MSMLSPGKRTDTGKSEMSGQQNRPGPGGALLVVTCITMTVLASMNLWQQGSPGVDLTPVEYSKLAHSEMDLKPGAPYERQQYFLNKRLPEGQELLGIDPYREARSQMRQMPRVNRIESRRAPGWRLKADPVVANWQWLGPGNVGGRTRRLVFDPDDPSIMFAAGVSGGLWKTVNGGNRWDPIADEMANINVGALVIDTVNPRVMYAGTGELYRRTLRPYSNMTGAGMFKSIDGGESWKQLDATINDNFLYVSDIIISPNDHTRLYAATNTGIWRSSDSGVSFEQVLFPSDNSGNALFEGCTDLDVRTDQGTDWVLASCASRSTDDRYWLPGLLPDTCNGPCDARIYLNTDAAGSGDWNVVLTEPGMGRTQMSIHAADQSVIYASSANTDGGPDLSGDGQPDLHNGLHAVFRSSDGGQSWQATVRNTDSNLLNVQLFSYADGAFNALCSQQQASNWYYSAGWYNHAIVASPIDPDVVWVAGMEIYRSDDGGRNFGMASHWDAQWTGGPGSNGAYVHADQHSLVYHPEYNGSSNRTLYTTNDGGVYVTFDDSKPVDTSSDAPCSPYSDSQGVTWRSLNNNYGVTQYYTGDVFRDGSVLMGGTQDNGTQMTFGTNPNWFSVFGGDGGYLAFSQASFNNFYVSSQNANIWRTEDGGFSYIRANNGLSGNFVFITPFILDPRDDRRLFAGGDRLWRSQDSGGTWQPLTDSLGSSYYDMITAIAQSDFDPRHLVFANQGEIFSTRSGLAFTSNIPRVSSAPREGWVSALKFDPVEADTVYATFSTFGGEHVWKSTDGGESFFPIDGSGSGKLPNVPVHDIEVNPLNNQQLFIATDLGIFVTVDGGANWQVENNGFSNVITETLVMNHADPDNPMLYAFTYGRGVWRVSMNTLDSNPDYLLADEISGLWYNASQSGHGLQIEVIDIVGVPSVYASWYTYLDGQPRWVTGIGSIENNRVIIDAIITDGAGHPPDFQASDVNRRSWGTMVLEFSDDGNGLLSWLSTEAGFGTGAMPITRLTSIAGNEPVNSSIKRCHSGTWYNRVQDGHGFMVEVLDGNQMVVTWFVYHNGEQYWLIAQGPIDGDKASMTALSGRGTSFPPQFETGDVDIFNWGSIEFTLVDDQFDVSWQPAIEGFEAGSLSLERLTSLRGMACN